MMLGIAVETTVCSRAVTVMASKRARVINPRLDRAASAAALNLVETLDHADPSSDITTFLPSVVRKDLAGQRRNPVSPRGPCPLPSGEQSTRIAVILPIRARGKTAQFSTNP